MSGDETFALVVFLAIGAWAWITCLGPAMGARRMVAAESPGSALIAIPVACAAVFLMVLATESSADVRGSGLYLFFYMMFGAAWVGAGSALLPRFGLSVRDDLVERRNWAAYAAIAGALLGLTLAFAGANMGNGPGWWVVLFSGSLSTGGLILVWWIVNLISPAHEHITVDRDLAAGLRTGALLVACGAILGRGAAGDWVDAGRTTWDFVRLGWPALPLALLGGVVERLAALDGKVVRRNAVVYGVLPGVAFLAAAGKVLVWAGHW